MPNRRRRKLSTAMSAVAALAVVSPIAVTAITDLTKPAPQPREFRQAAVLTDLPNELLSALSQGLSQFGINLPPHADQPADRLAHVDAHDLDRHPAAWGQLRLTAPAPRPGGRRSRARRLTALADPALTPLPAANPALTPRSVLPHPALPNPALTSPTGATPGGLTTPPVPRC